MRGLTIGLSLALLAGLGATARLAWRPLADLTLPQPAPTTARAPVMPAQASADSMAPQVIARNAFRFTRRPTAVAYDPQAATQPEPPPPPRPALSLLGIVWDGGPDPTALIEGFPGIEGPRAVRRGEQVGDLRIRTIARDHVIVLGPDTTWILTVRVPWR